MKAIAKLFETMLTKDATPTWGHQTGERSARGAGPERCLDVAAALRNTSLGLERLTDDGLRLHALRDAPQRRCAADLRAPSEPVGRQASKWVA